MRELDRGRIVVIAPHPDDETIGAGGLLQSADDAWIVQVTDGAPANMDDALRAGFRTRQQYAAARHAELVAAMRLAGVPASRILRLGFGDQELAMHLPELSERLGSVLPDLLPATILAPAYEGGHPDHDSVAFAVQASRLSYMEYALYHAGPGGMVTGRFLGDESTITLPMDGPRAHIKRAMLDCYVTQQETLAPFGTGHESFRNAPVYDFSAPPHPGRLYYENFAWGVTGEEWRALARAALP